MIQFLFRSNKSFCFASGHPITVPKGQVSYDALEALVGSAREGRIRFPDGSHVAATLYNHTAGFGPYYQIRARSRSRWAMFDAPIGMPLRIEVDQRRGALVVVVVAR